MKWNPNNLTIAQVGNGWRLLDEDEVQDNRRLTQVCFWDKHHHYDSDDNLVGEWSLHWTGLREAGFIGWGNEYRCSLRTRLTREEFAHANAT